MLPVASSSWGVLWLFLGSSFCSTTTAAAAAHLPSILFYRSAALLQQGEILIVRLLAESGTQVSLEEKYKLQRVEGETLAAPQSGFDTLLLLHQQEDSFASRLIKYSINDPSIASVSI